MFLLPYIIIKLFVRQTFATTLNIFNKLLDHQSIILYNQPFYLNMS